MALLRDRGALPGSKTPATQLRKDHFGRGFCEPYSPTVTDTDCVLRSRQTTSCTFCPGGSADTRLIRWFSSRSPMSSSFKITSPVFRPPAEAGVLAAAKADAKASAEYDVKRRWVYH